VGVFPSDDTFEEFSTPYGTYLASYMRHRPWVTAGDTATDYAIGNCVGDLHDGYSGASQLASFKGQGLVTTADNMGAVLWRQEFPTDIGVYLGFRLLPVSGTPTIDHFRWVGVCARASGGSYTETTGAQSIRDTTCYWAILAHKAGVAGQDSKWLILRVNSGTITQLATKPATSEVTAALTSVHEMGLDVTDLAGDPVLTIYYDGVGVLTHTDTSGSKITTAGRCGFGMVRDRQVSGVNVATVASYFQILDPILGKLLEDDFTRENIDCNPSVTDGNVVTGQVLMSMWTLDIHGPSAWTGGGTQVRDSGLNRVRADDGVYEMSQIPATDRYTQTRTTRFRITE
jgi:hypothetical protein